MRFMVMVKANEDSENGVIRRAASLGEMGKFNEELVKAGVMLAGEGLQPSSRGARVHFFKHHDGPSWTARSPKRRSSWPDSGCGR